MSELDYTTYVCNQCNEEKHITDYSPDKRLKAGHRPTCRKCRSESCEKGRDKTNRKVYNAQYYKDQARANSLRNKYGITPEQYKELLDRQEGCCALCERHQSEFTQNLAVDHNHATGEIRGLLCTYCNRYLVGRHRDGGLLRRIADYVDQGTGWFVPKKKRPVKRRPRK